MQTFLPYKDFAESAGCLDRHRLGKQRIETLEILVILSNDQPEWMSDGWYERCLSHSNHPAVLMWEDYVEALVEYGVCICEEWVSRGYADRQRERILEYSWGDEVVMPDWLTDDFVRRHRSNLLRKNHDYYSKFGWDVPADLPYLWPRNSCWE